MLVATTKRFCMKSRDFCRHTVVLPSFWPSRFTSKAVCVLEWVFLHKFYLLCYPFIRQKIHGFKTQNYEFRNKIHIIVFFIDFHFLW